MSKDIMCEVPLVDSVAAAMEKFSPMRGGAIRKADRVLYLEGDVFAVWRTGKWSTTRPWWVKRPGDFFMAVGTQIQYRRRLVKALRRLGLVTGEDAQNDCLAVKRYADDAAKAKAEADRNRKVAELRRQADSLGLEVVEQ